MELLNGDIQLIRGINYKSKGWSKSYDTINLGFVVDNRSVIIYSNGTDMNYAGISTTYVSELFEVITEPTEEDIKLIESVYGENREQLVEFIDFDDLILIETSYITMMSNNNKSVDVDIDSISTVISEDDRNKLIKEMKSKVNLLDLKKILSGIMSCKMGELKYIDSMLDDWANSKVEIYKMLGNNLRLSYDITIDKSSDTLGVLKNQICHKYPQYTHLLDYITGDELVDNKINNYSTISERLNNGYSCSVTDILSKVCSNYKFVEDVTNLINSESTDMTVTYSIEPMDFLMKYTNKEDNNDSSLEKYKYHSSFLIKSIVDNSSLVCYVSNDEEYRYKVGNYPFKAKSYCWSSIMHYCDDKKALVFPMFLDSGSALNYNVRHKLESHISDSLGVANMWNLLSIENSNRFIKCHDSSHDYGKPRDYVGNTRCKSKVAVLKGISLNDDDLVIRSTNSIAVRCLRCGEMIHRDELHNCSCSC